jgi:hypothetical protein
MHSNTPSYSARRTRRHADRRSHNRRAIVATGLAFGIVTAVAFTATTPAAEAQSEAVVAAPAFTLASYSTPLKATLAPAADATDSDAREAVAAAATVSSAAATVQADIAASGLDIGQPDPTVDTAALEAAAARLEAADALPAPLVPSLTDDVTELVASVDSRVNELRGSLDGAIAKKAEEEAAEKARLEAEAAAAAAAEAKAKAAASAAAAPRAPASSTGAASPAAPAAPVPSGGGSGDNSPAGAKATAYAMLQARGMGDDQYSCLVSLWQKESGWNYQASNRSSGAYGIPQALPGSKMASAGADWQTNAGTQISWGLGYISSRYGNPCGAWAKSQSSGWY